MADMDSREKTILINKTAGCLLFSVFGAMGFFYSLWRNNYHSAVWCLLLEIVCTTLLVFYKQYMKNELHLKMSSTAFRILKYLALLVSIGSFSACVAYIAVSAVNREVFDVRSHYAAAPVAFLAGFWYLIMFFDCRNFEAKLE